MAVINERHVNTYKRRTLISRKHKDFRHLFVFQEHSKQIFILKSKMFAPPFCTISFKRRNILFHHSLFGIKAYIKKTSTLKGLKFIVIYSNVSLFSQCSTPFPSKLKRKFTRLVQYIFCIIGHIDFLIRYVEKFVSFAVCCQ